MQFSKATIFPTSNLTETRFRNSWLRRKLIFRLQHLPIWIPRRSEIRRKLVSQGPCETLRARNTNYKFLFLVEFSILFVVQKMVLSPSNKLLPYFLKRSYSPTNLFFILSPFDRIQENLALETSLGKCKSPIVLLWKNRPACVIGRHQDLNDEINIGESLVKKVDLCRRFTGGGAVYQDYGNTCFSHLSLKGSSSNIDIFNSIRNALKNSFGILTEKSGRNDMLISSTQKKFSGSAHFSTPSHEIVHGTILRDVNLEAMSSFLTPLKEKLKRNKVQSVKSRVQNIKELCPSITHNSFTAALLEELKQSKGKIKLMKDFTEIGSLVDKEELKKAQDKLLVCDIF
eukprot:GHVP01017687.1.p1 GENE.GHVP01017687.1~~GHVP01017687.1.p1  ORF type:complete len:343 (+),score=51.26 GHVP01017687.1:1276-2304(+)